MFLRVIILLSYEFLFLQYLHQILHHYSISFSIWVYTIVLIESSFECHSLEKPVYIGKIILFRKLWEYSFVFSPVFSSKIERSFHTCEEDGDIFRPYLLDDTPEICFDIFRGFSLEGIIGSDAEDHERGSISLESPVDTREKSCSRISGNPCILDTIVVSERSQFRLELTRITRLDRESISCGERVAEGEDGLCPSMYRSI